jgi:molecular chaperone GrpE
MAQDPETTRPPEQPAEPQDSDPAGKAVEEPLSEGVAAELAELRAKSIELQKTADQLKDQLLRKAAEFENYRRRTETEYASVIRNANESLLLSILPVVDDFARSLKAGKDQKDFDALYRGLELIQNKLLRTLEAEGVKPFESVGKPFNVDFHDALLQIPRADVEPHTVIEEVERGYMYNDRVLRHAKVIVSSEPGAGDMEKADA